MAKKSLPVFVQLFILIAVTAGCVVGGYFVMKRTLPLAEISVDGEGIRIMNQNQIAWTGGVISINDTDSNLDAELPPIAAGNTFVLPLMNFQRFREPDFKSLTIRRICISDMPGFADRTFDVEKITINTQEPTE